MVKVNQILLIMQEHFGLAFYVTQHIRLTCRKFFVNLKSLRMRLSAPSVASPCSDACRGRVSSKAANSGAAVTTRTATASVRLTKDNSRDMAKKFEIRNSTAEFLIFQIEGKEDGVQVVYRDETVWCTQKAMAQLFDCSTDNIGLHLKNIYETGELTQEATTENFSVVQNEGERQVNRKLKFYNLDAIISVGYRVNSTRATQFRQWCTFQ